MLTLKYINMQKLIKNIVQKLIAWILYANKEINKEKSLDVRVDKMIEVKESFRNEFNDILDDLFSTVNLKKTKINWHEEEF